MHTCGRGSSMNRNGRGNGRSSSIMWPFAMHESCKPVLSSIESLPIVVDMLVDRWRGQVQMEGTVTIPDQAAYLKMFKSTRLLDREILLRGNPLRTILHVQ